MRIVLYKLVCCLVIIIFFKGNVLLEELPFSNAYCIIFPLCHNIHRVVFLISKCLKCYQIGRKISTKGGKVVGGGAAGINKNHISFQSLKTFFSLLNRVRFKHGRWGKDINYFANGGFAKLCRFYKLPRLFSVYVRYFKKRKKSAPSILCISFFYFFFSPPLLRPPLPSLPLPVLCTHCSACSSGETEKIALLLIR